MNELLAGLNDEQKEAVLHSDGNLLILAGAGSGKTRVITTKIAWLIREHGYNPKSILAVTFTNKAANEMKERACLLEPRCAFANLRTFHSFGAWFLRRYAEEAGLDRNFSIYDDDDSATLVRSAFPKLTRKESYNIASKIAMAKDQGFTPDSPELLKRQNAHEFIKYYEEYEKRLRATGNVDFGDLIAMPYNILRTNEIVRNQTHSLFKVILVDEFQDANAAQYNLLQAIASNNSYVCVVGDDDQSIYAFRGAEVKNILTFTDMFPNTDIIKLEKNYRSYQSILNIASSVVANNESRLGKTLHAVRLGGDKPTLAVLNDYTEEFAYVVKIINQHISRGGNFSDIAVLYRNNAHSLVFEHSLPKEGIPFRLVGSQRFYEREEIKDALALLSFVLNNFDEVAFRRIANKPSRGIGDASLEAIINVAFNNSIDFLAAINTHIAVAKSSKAKQGLKAFNDIIEKIRSMLKLNADGSISKLSIVLEKALELSELRAFHKENDEVAGTQKQYNLDELINQAAGYDATKNGLADFLEAIELDIAMTVKNNDTEIDAITLITMHNTKGLEFPVVIITGMEQGIFPRDSDIGDDLEEQRRLFYVALTRAMDKLFITYCKRRLYRGYISDYAPSIFLGDIPSGMINVVGGTLTLNCDSSFKDWKRGAKIYHDDYGYGYVTKVSYGSGSDFCVIAKFETGKSLQFFPKYTKKFELIKD